MPKRPSRREIREHSRKRGEAAARGEPWAVERKVDVEAFRRKLKKMYKAPAR